ncbi:MAG: LysM peptidoglycan-binding domain-containing protein [Bacteroidales bacterium]
MRAFKFLLLQVALWTIGATFAQDLPYKKEITDGKEYYLYQVESGEGLYSVCRKFNVSQEDILRNNKDAENGLRNGQTLRIPTKKSIAKVDESGYFFHTIDQGETLGSIALMYGVTTASIKKLNPEADRNIKIGFTLKIPQTVHAQEAATLENYKYHTISPRETLFSLAQKYNVSIQDILNSNPGLSASTFQVGKVVRINLAKGNKNNKSTETADDEYIQYTVQNNESIFSICRKFNISADSLLLLNPNLRNGFHSGVIIRVPMPKTANKESEKESEITDTNQNKKAEGETPISINQETLKVALLLPFMVDEKGEESAKLSRRFIEYYEGLMLALDKLKNEGISVDLHVYDTGSETKSISKILRSTDLTNANLIIGPVFNEHISQVSKLAKEQKIPLIIPFTSKNDDVLSNPNIVQINTPHSYLYAGAAQMFSKKFKGYQIIFLEELNKVEDKAEFISALKTELKRRAMVYKTFVAKNGDDYEQVASMLSTSQENIIVPTSGSLNDIKEIVPSLQSVAMNNPSIKISLFGYPEWQTYIKDYLDAFHYLNTYIYSTFFANSTASDYKEFATQFHYWYQRELINSYPKYGLLGFDTGLYFIKSLATTGNNFDKNVFNKGYHGIQTGFSLERVNNWGGLINKNVYLINYGRNYEITKLISDK